MARYEEVARSLTRRIEDSTYPVGSRMPTELDLADEYAVSRATIRSALANLERMGMVTRRRRIGTVVDSVRPKIGYARTVTSMSDLVQYSTETRREVLGRGPVVADVALARKLRCKPGERWMHITMLRHNDADPTKPLCHTDVYLVPEVAEMVGTRVEQPDGLINEIVERVTGRLTDRVEQHLSARAIPEELSEILHADAGSPALEIVRRYVEGSGTVGQVTVSLHPADRFEYTVIMERSDQ